MKTTRQLVTELQNRGYIVNVYIRKDGGVLIRSIEKKGKRETFKAAGGNARARQILGESLSAGRKKQTEYATERRKKYSKQRREGKAVSKPKIDIAKQITNAQRRINRKRRKYGINEDTLGIATKAKIAWNIKEYGEEETLKRLLEQERYTEGLAYSANIRHLLNRFQRLYEAHKDSSYKKIIKLIKDNAAIFKEEWIGKIVYDVINAIDEGIIKDGETAFNKVKEIMGIF